MVRKSLLMVACVVPIIFPSVVYGGNAEGTTETVGVNSFDEALFSVSGPSDYAPCASELKRYSLDLTPLVVEQCTRWSFQLTRRMQSFV